MKIGDQEWVLVPVKATDDMLREHARENAHVRYDWRSVAQREVCAYGAMLAAAPRPDIESMVEDLGHVIYDAMYAHQGGIWDANETKDVWYGYARAVLRHVFGE